MSIGQMRNGWNWIARFRSALVLMGVGISFGTTAWKPLWNGKSNAGWHIKGPADRWKIDGETPTSPLSIHGALTTTTEPYTMFYTDSMYSQFTVRVVYKITQGNSGFFMKAEETANPPYVQGLQVEIDAARDAGSLYCHDCGGWKQQITTDLYNTIVEKGDYNTLVLTVKGNDVYTRINDQDVVKWLFFGTPHILDKGPFGLQMHGGQMVDVRFRSVELLEGCNDKALPGYDKEGEAERVFLTHNLSLCASTPLLNGRGARVQTQAQKHFSSSHYPQLLITGRLGLRSRAYFEHPGRKSGF